MIFELSDLVELIWATIVSNSFSYDLPACPLMQWSLTRSTTSLIIEK